MITCGHTPSLQDQIHRSLHARCRSAALVKHLMHRRSLQEAVCESALLRTPSLTERRVHSYWNPLRGISFRSPSAREPLDLCSAETPCESKAVCCPLARSRLSSTAALPPRHGLLYQRSAALQRICATAGARATQRREQSRHPAAIILAVARVAARTSAANEPRCSSRPRCRG